MSVIRDMLAMLGGAVSAWNRHGLGGYGTRPGKKNYAEGMTYWQATEEAARRFPYTGVDYYGMEARRHDFMVGWSRTHGMGRHRRFLKSGQMRFGMGRRSRREKGEAGTDSPARSA